MRLILLKFNCVDFNRLRQYLKLIITTFAENVNILIKARKVKYWLIDNPDNPDKMAQMLLLQHNPSVHIQQILDTVGNYA